MSGPSIRAFPLSASQEALNSAALGGLAENRKQGSRSIGNLHSHPSLSLGLRGVGRGSASYLGGPVLPNSPTSDSQRPGIVTRGSFTFSASSTPSQSRRGSPRSSIVEKMSASSNPSSIVLHPVQLRNPTETAPSIPVALQMSDKGMDGKGPRVFPSNSHGPAASSAPARKAATNLLMQVLILRRVLLLTDGRDKVLKCIQYALKSALWADLLTSKSTPVLHAHAKTTVSNFSTARKIMRLLYWLNSLQELVDVSGEAPKKDAPAIDTLRHRLGLINAIVGIVNGWADDLVVAGKLGFISKPLYEKATVWADRMWFLTIFIDLHENLQGGLVLAHKLEKSKEKVAVASLGGVEDEVVAAEKAAAALTVKLGVHRVSLAKLLADLMFCSVDVLQLGDRGISDGWQALSGLTSALLGTWKVWIKHY
ncbi:hypothetical protein HKX48_000551 [Thoreauomyces humboldtii]|nr:hypothetical protein HKX48_000551 [Thoreauomyces humboldtii]